MFCVFVAGVDVCQYSVCSLGKFAMVGKDCVDRFLHSDPINIRATTVHLPGPAATIQRDPGASGQRHGGHQAAGRRPFPRDAGAG